MYNSVALYTKQYKACCGMSTTTRLGFLSKQSIKICSFSFSLIIIIQFLADTDIQMCINALFTYKFFSHWKTNLNVGRVYVYL